MTTTPWSLNPPRAKESRCLLCGSAMTVTLSGVVDNRLGIPGTYDIVRCASCRFEQTYPVPSAAELKRLYESHYNFGGERGTAYTRLRERFLRSFLYRIWLWLDGDAAFFTRSGQGRLLDVGCNEGRGLRFYARNGFHAEGLDLNENAAAIARAAGFDVHTCELEELESGAPYDVVVLSNVLEHALDPRRMLTTVQRILTPDGQLWLSCPNDESWFRGFFGRSWINWHVPFHVSHFSAETLRRLLTETGFTRIEIQQVTPALWVAQSFIAWLLAREGKRTQPLRNPFLVLPAMMFVRCVLFPVLWLANRRGHGDCLLAVATRASKSRC